MSTKTGLTSLIGLALMVGCLSTAAAQRFQPITKPQPMALRNLDMGRTFGPETSGTINQHTRVPKPEIITKTEWGGAPSSGTMRSHFPISLTIHHEGSPRPLTPDVDPKKKLQGLQNYGFREKNWPDLPYHYLIDLEGNIYEGRDPMKVGDTNTAYNPAGKLLITMMGNTDIQAPTTAQVDAMTNMLAWAADHYNIDPATIKGHMDYTTTACPGKYLYPYVVSGYFEGQVRDAIQKAYKNDSGT